MAAGSAPNAAPSLRECKVITVLFADLAGFASRSERSVLCVRERLTTYHRRVRQDAERYGGRVEKPMGDGVFAVFDVPIVHEDDPARAVRYALRIGRGSKPGDRSRTHPTR